jgi:hypothetical protein
MDATHDGCNKFSIVYRNLNPRHDYWSATVSCERGSRTVWGLSIRSLRTSVERIIAECAAAPQHAQVLERFDIDARARAAVAQVSAASGCAPTSAVEECLRGYDLYLDESDCMALLDEVARQRDADRGDIGDG